MNAASLLQASIEVLLLLQQLGIPFEAYFASIARARSEGREFGEDDIAALLVAQREAIADAKESLEEKRERDAGLDDPPIG